MKYITITVAIRMALLGWLGRMASLAINDMLTSQFNGINLYSAAIRQNRLGLIISGNIVAITIRGKVLSAK